MNATTIASLQTAATARAAKLCAEQHAYLAAGATVYVKGKKTTVPHSEEKRAALKRLAADLFKGLTSIRAIYPLVDVRAEGATDEESGQAVITEALAIYCAAGMAEVERCYAA